MILAVAGVAVAGAAFMFYVKAAGPFVSAEVEVGTITAPATKVTDATASGGNYVKFGPTATTPPPAYTCTKTLAAGGNVATFVGTIGNGETGCLRGGNYSVGSFALNASNARLASTPGERATITLTHGEVNGQGSGFERLNIISGSGGMGARLNGHNDFLYTNDFTNNGQGNVSAQCTLVGSDGTAANDVRIERNIYHNCGQQVNQAHAIYAQESNRLIIRDNIISGVGGYAMQLYPDAWGTIVEHNIVDADPTVRGAILADGTATNTTVRYNIISNNTSGYAGIEDRVGTGVANYNCFWNISGTNTLGRFSMVGNIEADPMYTNRAARDYTLRAGSGCLATVQYDTAAKINAAW